MSSRRVKIVLLCEDSQQEAFTRRFLAGMGWNTRELRVEKSPSAKGSAEQWVREKFPSEIKVYRQRDWIFDITAGRDRYLCQSSPWNAVGAL